MVRKAIISLLITAAASGGLGGSCADPGNANGGGKPKRVVITIGPGTTWINKNYYGMWHADDDATSKCQWSFTKDGKVLQSGGKDDNMLIGTSMRGASLSINASCVKFTK
jgi:hypothetical protein